MNKTTEALQNLVSGLNQTYWSSWQSTEKFMDALDKAEEVLKEERIRSADVLLSIDYFHAVLMWYVLGDSSKLESELFKQKVEAAITKTQNESCKDKL